MSPTAQIFLVGVGTYFIRLSAIALASRFPEPSEATQATLRLIGPAVLAAILADRLFTTDGVLMLNWKWLIAGVVASAVAYRWQKAGLTVAVGMIIVWLLDLI